MWIFKTVIKPNATPGSVEERTRMTKKRCSDPSSMTLVIEMQAKKPFFNTKNIEITSVDNVHFVLVCI